MAKKSAVEKNKKRQQLVANYAEYRKELRHKLIDPDIDDAERLEIQFKLQKLPRDTARIRVRNRCHETGRPRGYLRRFGLSRLAVREHASFGRLPGVTKASW